MNLRSSKIHGAVLILPKIMKYLKILDDLSNACKIKKTGPTKLDLVFTKQITGEK